MVSPTARKLRSDTVPFDADEVKGRERDTGPGGACDRFSDGGVVGIEVVEAEVDAGLVDGGESVAR